MNASVTSFELTCRDGQMIRGVAHDTGSGAVGLFLHGLLSDAEGDKSMTLWHEAQKHHRSWVRFDMRAHGQSDGTFDEFTISRALEDTQLVCDMFPDRPKILVGSSMGGWVAAQLGTNRALSIAGVVLIAPAFSFMEQLFQSLEPEQQQQWISQGSWTFDGDGIDGGFALSHAAVVDSRPYDLLENPVSYNCPVRILHGQLDDVVPAKQSLDFEQRLPAQTDIEVQILPNADHRLTGHITYITDAVDRIWPTDT